MVVEYLLLLLMSVIILAGSFGLSTGPVKMFQDSAPYLAYKVESSLETGQGFEPPENWEVH